jgi:hypothetical protein
VAAVEAVAGAIGLAGFRFISAIDPSAPPTISMASTSASASHA